jgi:acetyl-CoA decarbonylase/synthase, CODH/ACS complex subunit delta
MTASEKNFPAMNYAARLAELRWAGKTTGGAGDMPFTMPSKFKPPLLGLEVHDDLSDFPAMLRQILGEGLGVGDRLKQAGERPGVDFLALYIHQNETDWLADFLPSCKLPLIVYCYGLGENDPAKLSRIAALLDGRGDYIGIAEEETYRTVGAAALAHGLGVVAQSPMDMNLAKQLNILLADMGVPRERILLDPLPSSLGYGLQYTYTVSERLQLAGLAGDDWCGLPVLGAAGEAWAGRESWSPDETALGDVGKRALGWESLTGLAMIAAGASVVHFRNPRALELVRNLLDAYGAGER